jgi:outer membrane protein TolC
MRKRLLPAGAVLIATILAAAAPAQAQTPAAQAPPAPQMESVTFEEAVQRALKNNPTIAQAAEAVLRAEGLLQQARAATLPAVNATLSNTTLNTGTSFNGIVVIPRNQSTISGDLSMPVLAPARWAAASQARDQVEVANLSTADTRKQIAAATGQAYLAVITQHRQLEVNQRALDAARAHLDYAQRLLAQGAGTRLNELRAAQEVTSDEARLEDAGLAVRRAQEALGVLIAANGPVDAATEPTFDIPPATAVADETSWMATRTDVRLSTATERAFERVWHDSRKRSRPAVRLLHPEAGVSRFPSRSRFSTAASGAASRRSARRPPKPRSLRSQASRFRRDPKCGWRRKRFEAPSARLPASGLPRSRPARC